MEDWWAATAASRAAHFREFGMTDARGTPFRFANIDRIQQMVYRIDQQAAGQVLMDSPVVGTGSSDRQLVSSLVEEAITSSLLEGAATTRQAALGLLRTGRKPQDHGERMVWNNFHAMQRAVELAGAGDRLAPADVLELHRIVSEGTLEQEVDAGRLQQPGEPRVAVIWDEGQVLHMPPPAEMLPERLEQLCAFANGELGEGFLHPVVRAVLIHFWVGYDHPFVDGNGRTARALFYWSMLRSGYRLAQNVSISSVLRQAPVRYVRSYLHTETDSNDVTYFVIHQLEVLQRAIDALGEYLARKAAEIASAERGLEGVPGLNHRQVAIVSEALRHPERRFTIAGWRQLKGVSYQTARTDLLGLEAAGLLKRIVIGKRFEFSAADDLSRRLNMLSHPSSQDPVPPGSTY